MHPLSPTRVLVVEDEAMIAMLIEDMLCNLGCVPVGPAHNAAKALELIQSERFDAAILDVNLGGVLAYPVADMLVAREIPFIFTSGYEDNALRTRYSNVKTCTKPYQFEAMEEALVQAMSASPEAEKLG